MKTLYKTTPRIAAAILVSFVLGTGAAVALTHERQAQTEMPTLGRFTVTPQGAEFEATAHLGRIVVTPVAAHFEAATTA